MSQLEFETNPCRERKTYFADLILPVPIPSLFTYRVPQKMQPIIAPGSRVIVQFGIKKILTAIIHHIHENPPENNIEIKPILELLDESPLVTSVQMRFFEWVSKYYMCTLGEVINNALPSGYKISSESKIQLNPDYSSVSNEATFSPNEQAILHQLESKKSLTYTELNKPIGLKHLYPVVKLLIRKGAVLAFEEVKERYTPKKEKRIRLAPRILEAEDALKSALDAVEKYEKQTAILMAYLREIPVFHDAGKNKQGILKRNITEWGLSSSSLNALIKKNILEEFETKVSRFPAISFNQTQEINLSNKQQEAKESILDQFKVKNTVLLYGITGSGKTEIYIDLIKSALNTGCECLMLLPEIALTTQIVSRLRRVFSHDIGIYHSKFSDNERVEVWEGVLNGRFKFVIGVRSAIFLPFRNLKLVIVDEEHDTSYKQYDHTPRYQARDAVLYLSYLHGAKTLLGSATPSIESYYHALSGKYGFVELMERHNPSPLPQIELADIRIEKKKKTMQLDFSSKLYDQLASNLKHGGQSIIFQNRRGYAPFLQCNDCGSIPQCLNCDISLAYHQYSHDLRCHYCGYTKQSPSKCESCESTNIKWIGYGTEKLEESLQSLFTTARIARMDLDTTRKKKAYERIIEAFERGEIDILVGTQMVSKGFDFEKVDLVGILDADRVIHFPEFRSHERAIQLFMQVAGRAGRREKQGTVIIQTNQPKQDVLSLIQNHDYKGFYAKEISQRQTFHYPPFYRLIKIVIKSTNLQLSADCAKNMAALVVQKLGKSRVLGPEEPLVNRIKNQYLNHILIKLEKNKKVYLNEVKKEISTCRNKLLSDKHFRKCQVILDVDPG